ncbi:nudC domain-containing protein 3-like [Sinocyclocheilus rhinocerous]|uniref:nudC domain-containing protein 3-like n=1 Tax=Sinocyclocheilus rhinocerous TaxID=307959 RepID=UPI0007BA9F0F|nr:PREDICTED: nudC domain-containing protein 3-like [Sinocyclocheilus rhinocerous]
MSSPVEMTELYDNALLGILQHVGNIQNFLQVYFGFLYRKTDFYRLLSGPEDRMGFPPGVAEKMVFKTFKLFENLAEQDRERAARLAEEKKAAPPAVQELEVRSEQEAEAPVEEKRSTEEATAVPAPSAQSTETHGETQSSTAEPAGAAAPSNSDSDTANVKQDGFQLNADSYNGAVRENYTWSQDYTDVEVRVHVQPHIVKGRQVSVDLQSGRVRVALNKGGSQRVLMEGEFTHKINTENSLWSLEPGRCVLKVHEMLKMGWNAEGSPFKGQEFDPSMFNIPPSAVQL